MKIFYFFFLKSLGLIDEILDEMNDHKKSNEEMKQKLDNSVEKVIFHIAFSAKHPLFSR